MVPDTIASGTKLNACVAVVESQVAAGGQHQPADAAQPQAAANTGTAYAQYIVDDKTNEVVVKIRDAITNQIIAELPSQAVQAMDKGLRDYADLLARRRAAAEGLLRLAVPQRPRLAEGTLVPRRRRRDERRR